MSEIHSVIRSFIFDGDNEERVQLMMDKLNAPDVGAVVTEALQWLEWVIEEREAGRSIGSYDNVTRELTLVQFRYDLLN